MVVMVTKCTAANSAPYVPISTINGTRIVKVIILDECDALLLHRLLGVIAKKSNKFSRASGGIEITARQGADFSISSLSNGPHRRVV
jgi:hypothetical protein